MEYRTLCEVVAASHLTDHIKAPIEDRGGLALVAPPGQLKTTAATILSEFERKLIISNLTVKSLTAMRNDLLNGNIRTMIFTDYANIYRRHGSVSSNIEGIIMDLVGDGFRKPGYSDQRIQAIPARCMVIAAMTPAFKESKEQDWLDSGFYRRFLWINYIVTNAHLLDDALTQWRLANIDGNFFVKVPYNRSIPYSLDDKEQKFIRYTLRHGNDIRLQLVLAQKIVCVLKWKFPNEYMDLWKDCAEAFTPDGARITLKEKPKENR